MISLRRMTPSAARGGRGRHSFAIAGDLLEPLRHLSGDLFAVLVAVFDVLMLRYLGSDDIAVAARDGASDTLALRLELPDDPTFLDLLERVRNAIDRAAADPARIPCVEIPSSKALLVLSAAPPESYDPSNDASYDLIIALTESLHGLEGTCQYNSDQFEDVQARALTKHFGNLLKQAATQPGSIVPWRPARVVSDLQPPANCVGKGMDAIVRQVGLGRYLAHQGDSTVDSSIVFGTTVQQDRPTGSVIGFVSAKGGCGATTLACHWKQRDGRRDRHR